MAQSLTPEVRYSLCTSLLGTLVIPTTVFVGRCYGKSAGRRFAAGMTGALMAQQALVASLVIRGAPNRRHALTLVDVLTLTRGGAAAMLCGLAAARVHHRYGRSGWMGWLAVLYGAILCDWLDGPIARHLGTSEPGALMDLETDSWLTLCTAGASVAWGDLPPAVLLPPTLRYASMATGLRTMPYDQLYQDEPPWVRHLGIVQMLTFIGALAPFGGRGTRFVVRIVAPIETMLQIGGLLLLHHRRSAP